jgi:TetR/AcrR family transcriptional regulator, transcriptional repressor for nem operon
MDSPASALTTSQQILNAAERLVQMHGFNGFSYADIAEEVGITKASLHYHFSTKADLGRSLITRYHQNFFAALSAIDESPDDEGAKLRRYVQLYADVLKDKRMCLCGMLAAEFVTLPKPMKNGVKRFFDANETWLAQTLEQGRKAQQLRFAAPAVDVARTLIGSLEGAMLVARSYGSAARFLATANWLLTELGVSAVAAKVKRH